MKIFDPLTARNDALQAVQAAVLTQHRAPSSSTPKQASSSESAATVKGEARAQDKPLRETFQAEGPAKALYAELRVVFARHANDTAPKSWQA